MKKILVLLLLLLLSGCKINNDVNQIEDTPNVGNSDSNVNDGSEDNKDNDNESSNEAVDEKPSDSALGYTKAVWWWDNSLDDRYFDFALDNKVSEIYYCDSSFSDKTQAFIQKAKEKNIKVYLLQGEYQWIDDRSGLEEMINRYLEFQAKSNYKFDGIHFDIEPHQNPNFSLDRSAIVGKYVELVKYLYDTYEIHFQYDIPFWLEDIVEIDGVKREAYKWVIDYSEKIAIMSYRDTTEAILSISVEEYEYASLIGKEIMLGVEMISSEGEHVSFQEESKEYLNTVIDELFEKSIDGIAGIVIHHIRSWYDLKER